jgi:primosomal replication protein N
MAYTAQTCLFQLFFYLVEANSMWRSLAWTLGLLLLLSPAAWAQEKSKDPPPSEKGKPTTAAEKYRELEGAINKTRNEIIQKFQKAKTEEERTALRTEFFGLPSKYAGQFLELAEKNADDPIAFRALAWIVENAGATPQAEQAIQQIEKKHLDNKGLVNICRQLANGASPAGTKLLRTVLDKSSDKDAQVWACFGLAMSIGQRAGKNAKLQAEADELYERLAKDFSDNRQIVGICQQLANGASPAGEKVLRSVLEKSSNKDAQAWACYGLAKSIGQRAGSDAKLQGEAEKLYERVAKHFADVKAGRTTLAKMVERELFEIKHLAIGKVAPEIEGEDIDAVKFKLSEYRGKVVVLDFWGDW